MPHCSLNVGPLALALHKQQGSNEKVRGEEEKGHGKAALFQSLDLSSLRLSDPDLGTNAPTMVTAGPPVFYIDALFADIEPPRGQTYLIEALIVFDNPPTLALVMRGFLLGR